MNEFADRLERALKEAIESVRCVHDLREVKRSPRSRFKRMRCAKCGCTFYHDRLGTDGE